MNILAMAVLLGSGAGGAEFRETTPLPLAFAYHTAEAVNGRVFKLGGMGGNNGALDAYIVYSAPVQADGNLGAWAEVSPLPEPVFGHASAATANRIYVIAGYHFNGELGQSNKVYHAGVAADGTLGAWAETTPLPTPLIFPSAAAWNGAVYLTGGFTDSGDSAAVYFALIGPDGSLGGWTATTPLPMGVYTHTSVQHGRLYVLGGAVQGGTMVSNAVWSAPIAGDRTVGAWEAEPLLPAPLSTHASAVVGDKIFVTGGWDGTVVTNAVHSSVIQADLTLGDWTAEASLPAPRQIHGAAAWGQDLYVVGGSEGNGSSANVFTMRVPGPPTPPPSEITVKATVRLYPRRINRWRHGKWVHAFIGFPPGSTVRASDIQGDTVRITAVNGRSIPPIYAEKTKAPKGQDGDDEDDYEDGRCVAWGSRFLKARFDRREVAAALDPGDNVLTVEGGLADGRGFKGEDTLWADEVKPRIAKLLRAQSLQIKLKVKAAMGTLPAHGGRIELQGTADLVVPEGALAALKSLRVEETPDPPASDPEVQKMVEQALAAVSARLEFGPEGTIFQKPVTITIKYDRARLPKGASEDGLRIHWWNPVSRRWEALASAVDKANLQVSAETSHFSIYEVLAGGGAPQDAPPELGFGEVYAYPNPAKSGAAPTLHIELGQMDALNVKVFDVSGAMVHESGISGAPQLIDDGQGPQSAYEYALPLTLPSGVYLYVIEAHKGDFKGGKTGRFSVVR